MRDWLHLFLLAACWAPSFLFIKIALNDGVPPIYVVGTRVVLAALMLAVVLVARGASLPGDAATWRRLLPMAVLSTALPFALISVGEQSADSGMAAILNGTTPIFTVILAQVFLRDEPLTPRVVAGVAIGFAGIVLVFWPEVGGAREAPSVASVSGGRDMPAILGLAAFTAAAACYGAANVYARRRLRGLPPLVGPTLQMTQAGLMLMAASAVVEAPLDVRPSAAAWAAIVAMAVFGTALAYIIYYPLVARTSATFVSLVTYLLPPVGIALGMLVLDERPTWHAVAGCALVIVGVAVVNERRPARPAPG